MKEIELKGLNEVIFYHETKEGLPIYIWKNDKIKTTYMTLSVKYGSVHTKFKIGNKTYNVPSGIAHFLEHIKFNIDESRTAHDEFYKIGGDANAFTTFDYTNYQVYTTSNVSDNLNLLLDFVYNPYFTKKMIAKEKGIIIEEANMGMDDAYQEAFYKALENVLQKSLYRNKVIGSKEDIKSIDLDDIKLIYDTFYNPHNMFLCVTGNVNPYEIVKIVEENLNKKEFLPYKEPVIIKEPEPKSVTHKYREDYLNLSNPRIKYQVKLPLKKIMKKGTDLFTLKNILNLVLNINFGATSDFKDELMEKELILGIHPTLDLYDDYLILAVSATTDYKDEVVKLIREKFKNLSVTEEDFKRKKNSSIATLILNFEDVDVVNTILQDDLINYGNVIDDYKERLEQITLEDLEIVMKNISLDNVSVSVFLPKD